MRIFFDGQVFNSRAYGGGGRSFFELIRALTELADCEIALFAGAYRTPLPVGQLARKCRAFYGLRTPPLGQFLRRIVVQGTDALGSWCLDHGKIDIYHPTYYQPFTFHKKIPQVVTIFDLNHEHYPQWYPGDPTAARRKIALQTAAAVVCISETTGRQALESYPEIASKISVIPLASSLHLPMGTSAAPSHSRPYFLYVGNRNGYKNFRTMIEACRAIPRFAEEFTLICYGGGKFNAVEIQLLIDGGLQSCVEQRAGDDDMLASLYRDAICFIYPSLEEGFGIPLLEAMNCRCAVLASRIPVFEEVAGDAACYFDPNSPEDLATRMCEMVDDSDRRGTLIHTGSQRATLYSWERCARQHHELYGRVLSC